MTRHIPFPSKYKKIPISRNIYEKRTEVKRKSFGTMVLRAISAVLEKLSKSNVSKRIPNSKLEHMRIRNLR